MNRLQAQQNVLEMQQDEMETLETGLAELAARYDALLVRVAALQAAPAVAPPIDPPAQPPTSMPSYPDTFRPPRYTNDTFEPLERPPATLVPVPVKPPAVNQLAATGVSSVTPPAGPSESEA